jgi:hypothetical protein
MEEAMQRQTYGRVARYSDWFRGFWWPLGKGDDKQGMHIAPQGHMQQAPMQVAGPDPGFVSLVYHTHDEENLNANNNNNNSNNVGVVAPTGPQFTWKSTEA